MCASAHRAPGAGCPSMYHHPVLLALPASRGGAQACGEGRRQRLTAPRGGRAPETTSVAWPGGWAPKPGFCGIPDASRSCSVLQVPVCRARGGLSPCRRPVRTSVRLRLVWARHSGGCLAPSAGRTAVAKAAPPPSLVAPHRPQCTAPPSLSAHCPLVWKALACGTCGAGSPTGSGRPGPRSRSLRPLGSPSRPRGRGGRGHRGRGPGHSQCCGHRTGAGPSVQGRRAPGPGARSAPLSPPRRPDGQGQVRAAGPRVAGRPASEHRRYFGRRCPSPQGQRCLAPGVAAT